MNLYKYKRAIKNILFGIIISAIIHYVYSHWNEFYVIKNININALIYIAILQLVIVLLAIPKSLIVFRFSGLNISYADLYRVIILARFFNRFIPQFGNIYRAVVLNNEFSFPFSSYIAVMIALNILEKLFSLLFVLLILMFNDCKLKFFDINLCFTIGLILISSFSVLALLNSLYSRSIKEKKSGGWLRFRIYYSVFLIVRCTTNIRVVSVTLLISFLGFIAGIGQNLICFKAVGVDISITKLSLYNIALDFSRILILTPGNIGVTEILYAMIGPGLNVSISNGMIVAAIINFISLLIIFLLGISSGALKIKKKVLDDKASNTAI